MPGRGNNNWTRKEHIIALEHEFTQYVFIEADPVLADALRQRIAKHPKAHSAKVLCADWTAILGTSLPHLDDKLTRALEPRATSPTRRLRMLEKAATLGIPTYVAVAPFLPFHDHAVLEEVLASVLPLKPREVFCEVLNPKGDHLKMMQAALEQDYPEQALRLVSYSGEYWAKFTWKVLKHGV